MNAMFINLDSPFIKCVSRKGSGVISIRGDQANLRFHLNHPTGCKPSRLQSFLFEQSDWMHTEAQKWIINAKEVYNGVTLPWFGLHQTWTTKEQSSEPYHRLFRRIKTQSKVKLQLLAQKKAETCGLTGISVTVRDMRSRWGSCGHVNGKDIRISLNWRLAFAPMASIDYVIAHELAHINYPDHSAKFWLHAAELSEDFDIGKNWMRDHGSCLFGYGVCPERLALLKREIKDSKIRTAA